MFSQLEKIKKRHCGQSRKHLKWACPISAIGRHFPEKKIVTNYWLTFSIRFSLFQLLLMFGNSLAYIFCSYRKGNFYIFFSKTLMESFYEFIVYNFNNFLRILDPFSFWLKYWWWTLHLICIQIIYFQDNVYFSFLEIKNLNEKSSQREGFDLAKSLWYFYKNFLKLRKWEVADSNPSY